MKIKKHKLFFLIKQNSEIGMHKFFSSKKQNSEIEKRKPFFFIEHSLKIKNFIIQLTTLLENWDKGLKVSITHTTKNFTSNEEEDPIIILATKIDSVNVIDYN